MKPCRRRSLGIKFVFGYLLQKRHADATTVPAANVFAGKEVAGGESGDFADVHRHDWALVRLDRSVPAAIAEPVTNWETASIAKDQRVFVMGFPAGMPLKYAPGARVGTPRTTPGSLPTSIRSAAIPARACTTRRPRSWPACWWRANLDYKAGRRPWLLPRQPVPGEWLLGRNREPPQPGAHSVTRSARHPGGGARLCVP